MKVLTRVSGGLLFLVGVLTFTPIIAFFDAGRISTHYGSLPESANLTILLRHRGVLLGAVGFLLVVAAFKSEYRFLAGTIAILSKLAFVYLAFSSEATSEIQRIALFDVGAVVLILVALALHVNSAKSKS